eukprot:scaffold55122_cov63-Phaeocystis_antarctica.AAC.1
MQRSGASRPDQSGAGAAGSAGGGSQPFGGLSPSTIAERRPPSTSSRPGRSTALCPVRTSRRLPARVSRVQCATVRGAPPSAAAPPPPPSVSSLSSHRSVHEVPSLPAARPTSKKASPPPGSGTHAWAERPGGGSPALGSAAHRHCAVCRSSTCGMRWNPSQPPATSTSPREVTAAVWCERRGACPVTTGRHHSQPPPRPPSRPPPRRTRAAASAAAAGRSTCVSASTPWCSASASPLTSDQPPCTTIAPATATATWWARAHGRPPPSTMPPAAAPAAAPPAAPPAAAPPAAI